MTQVVAGTYTIAFLSRGRSDRTHVRSTKQPLYKAPSTVNGVILVRLICVGIESKPRKRGR